MSRLPRTEAPADAPDRLEPGLYIVASPIGNLADLSPRAADVLRRADVIACEDTRVTAKLLRAAASDRPMLPYHDHSPPERTAGLVARARGEAVALVSDAGTPLVSDPGYELVRAARAAQVPVTAIPGPSAAIAALSVSGLPTDRFFFAGFLPARAGPRADAILELKAVPGTLIFHESGPRLAETMAALEAGLGDRAAVLARELTKRHEEVRTGRLSTLRAVVERDGPPKGELVLLLGPAEAEEAAADAGAVEAALRQAMARMPAGRAAASVAAAFGLPRGEVYDLALRISGKAP